MELCFWFGIHYSSNIVWSTTYPEQLLIFVFSSSTVYGREEHQHTSGSSTIPQSCNYSNESDNPSYLIIAWMYMGVDIFTTCTSFEEVEGCSLLIFCELLLWKVASVLKDCLSIAQFLLSTEVFYTNYTSCY